MKKLFAAVAALIMLLSVTGCSKEALDNVSQFIEASGRDYGKTYTAKIGEEQKNSFFTTVVNSVEIKDEVNGYVPDEGYEFACVNITVKNIFDEKIIMGCGDFEIAYNCGNGVVLEDTALIHGSDGQSADNNGNYQCDCTDKSDGLDTQFLSGCLFLLLLCSQKCSVLLLTEFFLAGCALLISSSHSNGKSGKTPTHRPSHYN